MNLSDIARKIMEADDDKYVSIGYGRYKLKGKEDDDNAEVFTKTDSGQYVKSADQKSDDDKGGEEKPSGGGGGMDPEDFERDFGGDSGTDADFQGEPPEGAREPDDIDDEEAKAQAFKDMEDEFDMEEESITINGKKYRPIKESDQRIFKENYDKIFRSLK
jgi:hypothetical protein